MWGRCIKGSMSSPQEITVSSDLKTKIPQLDEDDDSSENDEADFELFNNAAGEKKTEHSDILEYITSQMQILRATDDSGCVIGHSRILIAIEKAFLMKSKRSSSGCNNILLVGLPGNGKSTILKTAGVFVSRALKKDVAFFCMGASTLNSKYTGVAEQTVAALFELADQHAPSLIVFDEVDAIMRKRTAEEAEHSRFLKNTLLSVLSGVKAHNNVITIAATNKGHEMDSGFIWRFESTFILRPPTGNQRVQLLKQVIKERTGLDVSQHEKLSLDETAIIKQTEGFSGSDIVRAFKRTEEKLYRYKINGVFMTDAERLQQSDTIAQNDYSIDGEMGPLTMESLMTYGLKAVRPSLDCDEHKKTEEWARKHCQNAEESDEEYDGCRSTKIKSKRRNCLGCLSFINSF